NIKLINSELKKYSEELAERPQIIVANKIDILDEEIVNLKEFERFIDAAEYELVYISAATMENIPTLINMIAEKLKFLPDIKIYETEYIKPEIDSGREITIQNVNGVYTVEGDWLYRLMGSINFEDNDSLKYFQKVLLNSGIIAALEEKGVRDGDTVSIYDFEFDFIK
ncbi:MAG: Obg family GTPase CgtA, partial [Oscillospiraceae bacterium]|nr:Obg family GTPase CgtA [Oscillospiraceae bacterium]